MVVKIFDLFSEADFQSQITEKMVKVQNHPSAPLAIANYTQVAQFNQENWNHVTDICRGLIWNTDTLEVVARPFVKFWNYGDERHSETTPQNLPSTEPEITRKEDGSLGIIFKNPVNGRFEVATRGSFTSDQAVWATNWIKDRQYWPEAITPLAEIIYPENRIVVDYKGWSGLKVLAGVRIEDGEELLRWQLEWIARDNDMEPVPRYNKLLSDAVVEDSDNDEGYVATWRAEGRPPLRVKIKMETYKKLHKILTGTSAIGIWELLRDGKSTADVFEHTPEEFKTWVTKTEAGLLAEHRNIESQARRDFAKSPVACSRKEFAEYAKSTQQPHLLFALLDGKNIAPLIWKTLRPTGDIRPFKQEEE